jgi:probable rRNA maturation factor
LPHRVLPCLKIQDKMVIEFARRGAGRTYPTADLKKIAVKILAALEQHEAELSIALVGDKEMRPLNASYRKKNKTTDVLSFPAGEKQAAAPVLLGDVIISVEQARRQAGEREKSLKSEMVTLLIHGILHLLGYDHERSPRQAKIMAGLEQKLLRDLCDQGLIKV